MRVPCYEMRRYESDPAHVYWVDAITGNCGGRMKFDEFQEVVSGKKRQPAEVVAAPGHRVPAKPETEAERILNDINETLATLAQLKPPPPEAYIVGL